MRHAAKAMLPIAIWLVVTACAGPQPPVQVLDAAEAGAAEQAEATATQPVPIMVPATPEAVLTDLGVADSLEASAADLAEALGVDPQRVRVHIQTSTCTICKVQEDAALRSVEGLSLEDAAKRIVPGEGFFLFVGRFTCFYRYDGTTYTPRTCQYAPI